MSLRLKEKIKQSYNQLQHRLQRVTKTDTRYLARNSFWVTLAYTVQVLSGALLTVVLARELTKEDLGVYQFVLAVAGVISAFTLTGLGQALVRGVAKGNGGLLRTAFRYKLLWSTLITLAAGIIASYYALKGVPELALAFLLVGASAPFIESFKLYENFLQGKEAFRDTALLGAWRKPIPLIALIITAYLYPEPLALVAVYFITNALSYGLVYRTVLQKYPAEKTHDRETFRLGWHLSLSTTFSRIVSQFDKLIIYHFLGPVAVASYTIAQLGSRYSGGFISSAAYMFLPKLAKQELTTLQETLPRKVLLFTLVMAVGVFSYIIIAPYLFALLFPNYPESVAYSQVLMLGFLFMPRIVYGQALVAHNQIRSQYILTIVSPVVRLTGMLLLIIPYGVWGVIVAILIDAAVTSALSYLFFKRAEGWQRNIKLQKQF